MNTYDKSSLVLIPSGIKDGKIYSQRPENGSGDFTFSRGSNLAATRVDENGLIEKGRENLLLQSNGFNNWINSNTTETSGQSGYDSSSDAWLLEKSAASGFLWKSFSGSGVYSLSLYAKAGTLNSVFVLILASGGNGDGYFNLSTGTVGTFRNNAFDAKIEDVGNGWYRCSLVGNYTNISQVRIYPANDESVADTSGSIYIQDAQLEVGLVATDYIETTTTTAQAGILEDMPRLDYSGGASCPSLLLEPQRTNLIDQSEYLSVWAATRCVISDNDTTSPDGAINASKMTSNDAAESYIQRNATLSGSIVAYSFYAKKGDLDYVHSLVWDVSANGCRQWFNLANGTIGSSTTFGSGYSVNSASIEDMGNGWYRCITIVNCSSGTNGFRVNISSADSNINSPVNSYGYFWGIQAEDSSSYPTSYIPCYGAATTRSFDSCSKTGISSLIGQEQGTIFIDFNHRYMSSYPNEYIIDIEDGSNKLWIRKESAGNTLTARLVVLGVNIWTIAISATEGNAKIALAYSSGDSAVYYNGSQVNTSSATFSGNSFDDIYFNLSGSAAYPELKAKQFAVYKTRLTNGELAALTTL